MKKTFMLLVILPWLIFSAAGQNKGLADKMRQNMSEMHEMELTGDPDYDFSRMMIMHHQGGLEITEEVLGSNAEQELLDLASEIKEDQENDIAELEKFTAGKTQTESDSEFLTEIRAHMQQARVEMSRVSELTGDLGKDFLILMSMHHDHGIKMTDIILKNGKSSELKAMAKQMREKQQEHKSQLDELK